MNAAAQGALTPRADHLRAAVVASAVIHAAALVLAAAVRPAPIVDLEQKPIVARLVRLGEKRPENLLPRKEEAAPGEPSPGAMPVPTPPAAKPVPAPKPPAAPSRRSNDTAGKKPDAFAQALSRIRRDKALSSPTGGDPSGDPLGDASDGEPGDRYLALVLRALQETYRLPATISERDRLHLKATVILYIEPDGRVSRWSFESRSGNAAFDDALDRAIRQARLPPPPAELRERYRSGGLGVRYSM